MPLNGWAADERMKELGELSERNWLLGLGGFTMGNFTRVLDWTKTQIEVRPFEFFSALTYSFGTFGEEARTDLES